MKPKCDVARFREAYSMALSVGLAFVIGCASGHSRIQNYGPGRFSVSYSSMWGVASARVAAIREANSYCADLGKVMDPLEENSAPGRRGSFALIFACVSNNEDREGHR